MNNFTPPFQGFDDRAPVRIYDHGILPHWRQQGCTYFVTFRLADSLPGHCLEELRQERETTFRQLGVTSWKEARLRVPGPELRHLTRTLRRSLEDSLDAGAGECLLRNPASAQVVSQALRHFHGTRVFTGEYVIMPNHVHALLRPLEGYELEDILHAVKSFTATTINRLLGRSGIVWQRESHDHIVRNLTGLERIQDYIRQNPAKARLPEGAYVLYPAEAELA